MFHPLRLLAEIQVARGGVTPTCDSDTIVLDLDLVTALETLNIEFVLSKVIPPKLDRLFANVLK
jgi:hypothetical protein